jgi:hypothetical protein
MAMPHWEPTAIAVELTRMVRRYDATCWRLFSQNDIGRLQSHSFERRRYKKSSEAFAAYRSMAGDVRPIKGKKEEL